MTTQVITRLPSPQEFFPSSPGKTLARQVDEATFLTLALNRIQQDGIACFLDSAGPLHERSRRSLLSGSVRGLFLEENKMIRFIDLGCDTNYTLTRHDFSSWLEAFAAMEVRAAGPMLFPLLTYESFNPAGPARLPHVLWPDIQAAWLLTNDSMTYDRESQTLLEPEHLHQPTTWSTPSRTPQTLGWRESEQDYHDKIVQVQRDIKDGIYYQANLSQRFVSQSQEDVFEVYRRLRNLNPSPFMGIFRLGDHLVLSGSPERLVDKRGDLVSSRPIAGTRPRFHDPTRDAGSRRELCASEKENAEHLMLVDLIRNDLGRVAATGSVRVDEFLSIESYSHVHHLVSEVRARLADGVSLCDLIASMFPGGTITGAPKISCMQRLRDLEGEARGPYTGSMGYIAPGGDLDLNILIRTLIVHQDFFCLHAGGGIVADSIQKAEFQEARYKGAALLEALGIEITTP